MSNPFPPEAAWLGPVFAFTFGLVLGSFANVLIHRLPRGQSVVFPRSRCPRCGKAIAPYDNIPVVSYILLTGRCRQCRGAISIRYPLVELAAGALSLGSFLRHGVGLEYCAEVGFVGAMLVLIFVDYEHRILPDAITLPGTAAGLVLAGPLPGITFWEALGGAVFGAGLLFVVGEAYFRLRKTEGLGMGDVKMMGMVGAFLGWKSVLLTLLIGSLLGTVVGLGLMVVQGKGLKTALPFGTFLGVAATAAWFTGPVVIAWYSGFF